MIKENVWEFLGRCLKGILRDICVIGLSWKSRFYAKSKSVAYI